MNSEDTVTYKDVQIPKRLAGIVSHMKSLEDYREELRILAGQWDLLTILGQISGTGTNMTTTREGFKILTSELLSQLGTENLKKVTQEIGSKAQVAVDIVIRNLFERTADIGFLATDNDIRKFILESERLANLTQDECDEQEINKTELRQCLNSMVIERFNEYTQKYSVYFDIILLDTKGNVLAQMDQTSKVTKSDDDLIYEALNTDQEYVEVFRETDLLPDRGDSLIYAYRVTETNSSKSRKLGVLCLCFRFENEMEGIFKNLASTHDWSVISLLDKNGCVMASSNAHQIPVGINMEMVLCEQYGIVRFSGRLYLAKTCATKGYQGFYGLGWYGHVMIPIEHAFDASASTGSIDKQILHAVMEDPKLFSKELRDIPIQADRIQSELERTVWNGNITGNDPKSKILLWNISDAGAKTKKVFEDSIGNLHETVVASVMNNVWFWAALSVDIMDRNLYERANDCRWWALTSDFRSILAQEHVTKEDSGKMSAVLQYINNLYTVYTNLFVYDRYGVIQAVSNEVESHLIGSKLSEPWVRETLALRDTQSYSVSYFEKTALYNARHTYIYGASITNSDSHEVVGGIGIVFDSEPQFEEMLQDSLPRNEKGEVFEGCFGVFTDRNRVVLSSTLPELKTGDVLEVPSGMFAMANGEGKSEIINFENAYYAVGAHASSGYREYKTCDNYNNDVIGFVFVPLAQITEAPQDSVRKRDITIDVRAASKAEDSIEVATFFIGSKWLGIKTEYVLEAVKPDGITFIPGACQFVKGQIIYDNVPTVVLDIRPILQEKQRDVSKDSQIIIIKAGKVKMGLLVDGLGEIPEIPVRRVEEPDHIIEDTRYTDCIVKPDINSSNQEMLVVLHPDGLLDCIKDMI
ncbi:MAG: chemotaxis protein CheW [Denitrovibrio sp.]|nr:MAG: chemotaxis protein CheW [Denitrovibrio sp.]